MRPSTSETYGNIRKYPSALQLHKIWKKLFVGSFFVHFVEDPLGMQRLQQKVWSVTTLFAARCPPKPLCPWHFDPPKPSNQKGGKMGKALTRGTCAVLPLVVLNKLSLEHQREAFTRYHNIVSHVVLHGTPVLSQNCTELVQHPPPYINTLPVCTSCGYEVAFCFRTFRLWNHWKPTLISFLPSSSIMIWIMMFILVILNDHMISKGYASHTHTFLDPSHPIALLAWLSASIKDLVPGLAAALAAENPKSEFAMLNSTCSTCSTCSTAQGLLEYFFDLLGWPNSTTVPFVSLSSRPCTWEAKQIKQMPGLTNSLQEPRTFTLTIAPHNYTQ